MASVLTETHGTFRSDGTDAGLLRILDANINRATEGLRVVEEYLRFVLEDQHLTSQCKQLRHDMHSYLSVFLSTELLATRDTEHDVGTTVRTSDEYRRQHTINVVEASFKRVQQSMRSLEEYSKLLQPSAGTRLESLRYRTYSLEKATAITATSRERLQAARVYVLMDGRRPTDQCTQFAHRMTEADVDILQLRAKGLDDRELLKRGHLLRQITRSTNTLFIMNDRADLAAAAGADGVHLGQEDISVKDARLILGPSALIGISTHSADQARQAIMDGANYIGVGPTFASSTKNFESFPGTDLLRTVSEEISLPAFAIGGINLDNLSQVMSAGFTRVAVQGAVNNADDPVAVVRRLAKVLRSAK